MNTRLIVLHPSGQQVKTTVDLPERPKYGDLSNVMRRFLGTYSDPRGGEPVAELMEHVSVLVDGERRDMFVCELGDCKLRTRGPLPFNPQASALMRAVTLAERPDADPDTLAKVCGVAVLFDGRRVWFAD